MGEARDSRAYRKPIVCDHDLVVARNDSICAEHFHLDLIVDADPGFPSSHPGQFLQIRCANSLEIDERLIPWSNAGLADLTIGVGDLADQTAFLRRPFSIADRWTDGAGRTHLLIIHRAIGPGTRWLKRLAPGDRVSVTGPLGNGFVLPPRETPIVLVGGGVGIPPLVYLSRLIADENRRRSLAIFGARGRQWMPLKLLREPSIDLASPAACVHLPAREMPTILTTDDGTLGLRGRVTDALRQWWHTLGRNDFAGGVVMACGPEPMLEAVAKTTRELGLQCQLCIERMMGCGLGTCLSCVVRVKDASRESGWRFALTCGEGPVFDRDALAG